MPFIIDGIEISLENESVLDEIMRIVQKIYEQQRFVKHIILNGREVTLDSLSGGNTNLRIEDHIEIQSYSLDELVQDAMSSAADYVPNLTEALSEVIHAFRTGDLARGSAKFAQTIDGVRWVISVLSSLCSLHPGPSEIHDIQKTGMDTVPLLMNAWDSQDFVLLADIIEYEVLPWMVKWDSMIHLFQAQMGVERKKAEFRQIH